MVAAAVRAAVSAKAPRRTVSAVAAAVASALARPVTVDAKPRSATPRAPAETQPPTEQAFDGTTSESVLLEALRSKRREQRRAKKARHRA